MKTLGDPPIKAGQVLAVLALFYLCIISPANALWVGGNIDVHNNTGQDAHDFHIKGKIKSTTPPELLIQIGYVDGTSFPDFSHTITHAGGDLWDFEAEWSSLDVLPSQVGHFGLFFDATCRNVWVDLDGWWTDADGDPIGPWPILGFEVPTHWWDPPAEQVFRLQGDAGEMTIDTEIIAMDLMYAPPENAGELFGLLNADDSDQLGEWTSVPRDKLPGDFPADSFFDVFVEIDLGMGGIRPNQLLLARTRVTWPGEPDGRWFFHVHQAHSKSGPEVVVDIKPESCPNPLNIKSKGVLPVAVLGTGDFGVIMIDPATIGLSREGVVDGDGRPIIVSPLRWASEDVATPFEGELCDCDTLGPDGYLDLTLKFSTPELVGKLELDEVAGETIPLTLTGSLKEEFSGTPIRGEDCISVLEKKGPQRP